MMGRDFYSKPLNLGDQRYRGALVYRTANQSISDLTWTHLNFTAESYDTDSIHDNATNNQRLVVPSGVTEIKLKGEVIFDWGATGEAVITISKNDDTTTPTSFIGGSVDVYEMPAGTPLSTPVDGAVLKVSSAVIDVVAGDYFTLAIYHNRGVAENVIASDSTTGCKTFFSMEIVK